MVLSYACTHLCRRVYTTGVILFENVPFVEFIYLVFTRTSDGVTVGHSRLCSCVPCLSSAIISLCLLFLAVNVVYVHLF